MDGCGCQINCILPLKSYREPGLFSAYRMLLLLGPGLAMAVLAIIEIRRFAQRRFSPSACLWAMLDARQTVATAAAHALLFTSTIEPNRDPKDPPRLGELMANAKKRPFARGLGRKIVHAHERRDETPVEVLQSQSGTQQGRANGDGGDWMALSWLLLTDQVLAIEEELFVHLISHTPCRL